MADELKRLGVIAAAILIIGSGVLFLPLMKLQIPERPTNVPPTALYARGRGASYWINCPNITSPTRYYCTVYSRDGSSKLVEGVFQESGATTSRRIAYDGSSIDWKHAVLYPLHLDCVAGGRPPEVADCRTSAH
jgi:hypothetical protein